MGFIYKVTNKINGKVYIGKTLDSSIEERFKEHIKEAKVKQYHRPFHLALNKYGAENFTIEEVEQASAEALSEKEKYWISYYHSYIHDKNSNGYNATRGGEGSLHYNYQDIIDEYYKTKSITQTAINKKCHYSTVKRALTEAQIPVYNKSSGISVIAYNDKDTIEFNSIKQAAEYLAIILNKNSQTVRKRITYILRHQPHQLGYGYYWQENS